jgi:serine/threonine protein kinase
MKSGVRTWFGGLHPARRDVSTTKVVSSTGTVDKRTTMSDQGGENDDDAEGCGSFIEPSTRSCMKDGGPSRSGRFMRRQLLDTHHLSPGKGPTLGEGVYGTVVPVTDQRGEMFAAKISLDVIGDVPYDLIHELEIRNATDPHVTVACSAGTQRDAGGKERSTIVMERAEMSVRKFCEKTHALLAAGLSSARCKDDLLIVAYQAAIGVEYTNTRMLVANCDIKPDNFLVYGIQTGVVEDPSSRVMLGAHPETIVFPCCTITDFGISHPFIERRPEIGEVYTLWYRCPELLLGEKNVSFQAEVWALGCVIYEILTGVALFGCNRTPYHPFCQLEEICKKLGTPTTTTMPLLGSYRTWNTDGWSAKMPLYQTHDFFGADPKLARYPDARDLLRRTLVLDPSKRLTVYEISDHPLFSNTRLVDQRLGATATEATRRCVGPPSSNRLIVFGPGGVPTAPSVVMAQGIRMRSLPALDVVSFKQDEYLHDWYKFVVPLVYGLWAQLDKDRTRRTVSEFTAFVAIDIIRCLFKDVRAWQGKTTINGDIKSHLVAIAAASFGLGDKYANDGKLALDEICGHMKTDVRVAVGWEWEIVERIDFDLYRPTVLSFIDRFVDINASKLPLSSYIDVSKRLVIHMALAILFRSRTSAELSNYTIAVYAVAACIDPNVGVTVESGAVFTVSDRYWIDFFAGMSGWYLAEYERQFAVRPLVVVRLKEISATWARVRPDVAME